MSIELKVLDQRVHEWGLPKYATSGAAAVDLVACVDQMVRLYPGSTKLISTGIAVHIADPGIAALILPRSGLGTQGLVLANTVGLIDADYQGPITVAAWNRGNDPIDITPGHRFAQMVFLPVIRPKFEVVSEFTIGTLRGSGGFGSTG